MRLRKEKAEPAGGPLGILAGGGELPWLAAREALRGGEDVRIFCFSKDQPPADLAHLCDAVVLTKFYSSTLATLHKRKVRRLILLGKATRDILYDRPRFDARTILLVARMVSQSDYALFSFLAGVVEKEGITILPQDLYLRSLYLPEGRYGAKLDRKHLDDVAFGLNNARAINQLDIGQTVVVGDHAVLAVEAAEGTDQCIRRGGGLFKKKGAVVCKLAKDEHDRRFDIPASGLSTLTTMAEANCSVLAFDASHTFVVTPREFLDHARRLNITVLALDPKRFWNNAAYLKDINQRTGRLTGE